MTAPVSEGFAFVCPVCSEEVPDKGYAIRRIPWKGGQKRRVHLECAEKVEAQATLDVEPPKRRRAA